MKENKQKMNLDNLKELAQHNAVKELKLIDFYALKGLTPDAITFWPKNLCSENQFYLRINDRESSGHDFVKVHPCEILPGDDVLVVRLNGSHEPQSTLIENISHISSREGSLALASDYIIEGSIGGSPMAWTSIDMDRYIQDHVYPALEFSGLTEEDITAVFNPSMTFDEFNTIQTLMRNDIQITDQMLYELSEGTPLDQIVERETGREENEFERNN